MDILLTVGGICFLFGLYITLMIWDEQHRTTHCTKCGKELKDVSEVSLCISCHASGI